VEALLAHEPEHLLAQQQLQTLEEQFAGLVAGEVFPVGVASLFLLADDATQLAKVIVLVNVELDVALARLSVGGGGGGGGGG
jgi:hypothetical protein